MTRTSGPAGPVHHRAVPDPVRPEVWIHAVDRPALVLGSAQSLALVHQDRAEADGVEVVRRRSGGGLVALVPGNDLWVDLVLPRTSALWCDDVGRAFTWLGRTWAGVLADRLGPGAGPVVVHPGPLLRRRAGAVLCFAGLGPGEVTVAGRKVVGLSLRRWRTGCRFQCAMTWRWEPDRVGRYLDPGALGAALAADGLDLASLPIGLPDGVAAPPPEAVADALLAALPDPACW